MVDPAPMGVLLVDKPTGPTSHDVVARARRALGTKKVGHAGTLDPAASGLLVLGVGAATRLLTFVVGLDKTYTATIRLGAATTTDDAEGETVQAAAPDAFAALTPERIRAALSALTGHIAQVPSSVSAIKVDGERAYARVRAGESVQLAARPVTVHALDLVGDARPGEADGHPVLDLDVRAEVSSGTYIRALARDLGADLGVGGHLVALRRTRVGPFDVADAAPLAEVDRGLLRTPADIAGRLFPVLGLETDAVRAVQDGKRIEVDHPDAPVVAVLDPAGDLVGLAEVRASRLRVLANLPSAQPVAAQPVATQPVAAQPAATQPVTARTPAEVHR